MKKKIISSWILSGLLLGGTCVHNAYAVAVDPFETTLKNSCLDTKEKQEQLLELVSIAADLAEDSYAPLNRKLHKTYFGNINGVASGYIATVKINNMPYVIVSIHGTANMDDAITDAQATQKQCEPLDNIYVHKGFCERYTQFNNEMINKVKICYGQSKAMYEHATGKSCTPKILVTGHSLGGALSTLAALELEKQPNFRGLVENITFCSPRVLSKEAYKYAEKLFPPEQNRVIRVYRMGDTVAKVNLGTAGYKHFGTSWGLDKAPGEDGLLNYANTLAWHSITNMARDMRDLRNKKLDFDKTVKINSKFSVLRSMHSRLGRAVSTSIGSAASSVANTGKSVGKAIGSKLLFWR